MLFFSISTLCSAEFYSQCKQDQYVYNKYFRGYRNGIFVDIGAHDGISLSNTYFFEKVMGWTGICVEPIPSVFANLQKNRNCTLINGCIADWYGPGVFLKISGPLEMFSGLVAKYSPQHTQVIQRLLAEHGGSYEEIDVNCFLFNDIVKQNGITRINFLSLDTEGGEFEILSSIDFDLIRIDVITLENNYADPRFVPFLRSKGFRFVTSLDQDMIFVNKKFRPHKKPH